MNDNRIKDILYDAGEILAERFHQGTDHSEKERYHITTSVDTDVERLLVLRLKDLFPDDGFLGEECGEQTGTSGNRWLIDPIDGTTDFIMGKPYFAVSLAREKEGRITEGYVYNPISRELYTADEKDGGAYLNGKAISVSKTAKISDALVASDSARR